MSRIRTGSALLLFSGLCACASPPTRFYTLDAQVRSGPAPSFYTGPPLRLDAVHIPPAFDRSELVEETAEGRLVVRDADYWAAPLAELFRRVLTQDLLATLPQGRVIFPDAPKPAGACGAVVDILALTPSAEGLVMDVSWTLLTPASSEAADGKPIFTRRSLRLTASASSGPQAQAHALSQLAAELAAAMAATLAGGGPPS